MRWGGGAAAATKDADAKVAKELIDAEADAAKPKDGPIATALKENEGLSKALESLAANGDVNDPGIIARTFFFF